jgi:oxygen-independent coproporphyrinogen-3 oxidase
MNAERDILARYSAIPVPRYTSYPTAAEFSPAVGPAETGRWLGRLGGEKPLSVYLHVPFCRQLCHYCGCHAKAVHRDTVIETYIRALSAEIETVATAIGKSLTIGRIHWGGGTPTSLGIDGLTSIVATLSRHFRLGDGAEHAIELDPRLVTAELAGGLAGLGVTRASLGVQDTNPLVQAAIGRMQPIEQVGQAFAHLRAAGIASISADLIYGLPLQTVASLKRTCEEVAALRPDRIACYGYAHMPERRANQRLIDARDLPDSLARIDQAETVSAELKRHGYQPVGIDHFALEGNSLLAAERNKHLHRNFQGYTDDDCSVLIGFGASAISHLPDGYAQNEADPQRYVRTALDFNLATVRGCRMSVSDRVRARLIERMMCEFRVDLDEVAPDEDLSDELALLRPLIQDGLATLNGRTIAMTERGKPLVRVAAALFDSYRRNTVGRFSPAL